MPKELRLYYSPNYIKHVAKSMQDHIDAEQIDIEKFILDKEFDGLTLKQRMAKLTQALRYFLPDDYLKTLNILKKMILQVSGNKFQYDDLLSMFIPSYVELYGQDHFQESFEALAFFTANGTSSEFAIRPFIIANQEKTMKQMLAWSKSDSLHIRRFASEGCRPRLPWAMQLPDLRKNPEPILPILKNLLYDNSKYVQKSVANNLNDISKDHPDIVLEFAKKYKGQHQISDWILKHGCRTLLKKSDNNILRLFGAESLNIKSAKLSISNNEIIFGNNLEFQFTGKILGALPDILRIEYAIDFMKANGKLNPKIFKISEKEPKTHDIKFSAKHKFIPYSTRKHYPGRHVITIIINGDKVASCEFNLVVK